MLNLLVHGNLTAWESGTASIERERFLEHTVPQLSEQFAALDPKVVERLKQMPALFSYERQRNEETAVRLGRIYDLRITGTDINIRFEFYPGLNSTSSQLEASARYLGLNKNELYRTHWAIKDVDVLASGLFKTRATPQLLSRRIFIVHGHDHRLKDEVEAFVSAIGLVPVILHQHADRSQTVIEKFERHADVGFAVALLTPDDALENGPMRARQNVMLELGYFVGKLGRARVCALRKGRVQLPSDIVGILYKDVEDVTRPWRDELLLELNAAGYDVSQPVASPFDF
jgi:predicted nucleotide-binding protein